MSYFYGEYLFLLRSLELKVRRRRRKKKTVTRMTAERRRKRRRMGIR